MPIKKMTDEDILSRTKAKHYVTLSQAQVVNIVKQLPADKQKDCFSSSKKISPLSKIETGGILVQVERKDATPISKIPIEERRKIIKDLTTKDADLKKFLEDNKLYERSQVIVETEVAGDFSPSKFWQLLNTLVSYDLLGST